MNMKTPTARIVHAKGRDVWHWPLPKIGRVAPCIVETVGRGAMIGYGAKISGDRIPVFAVRDGVLTFAARLEFDGAVMNEVSFDHHDGWSSHYGGLSQMLVTPTDRFASRKKLRVRAGDTIGYVTHAKPIVRLEVWRIDCNEACAIDIAQHVAGWIASPWAQSVDEPQLAA
jgi:hypothetical protein